MGGIEVIGSMYLGDGYISTRLLSATKNNIGYSRYTGANITGLVIKASTISGTNYQSKVTAVVDCTYSMILKRTAAAAAEIVSNQQASAGAVIFPGGNVIQYVVVARAR